MGHRRFKPLHSSTSATKDHQKPDGKIFGDQKSFGAKSVEPLGSMVREDPARRPLTKSRISPDDGGAVFMSLKVPTEPGIDHRRTRKFWPERSGRGKLSPERLAI